MKKLARAAAPALLAPEGDPTNERGRAIRHFEVDKKIRDFDFRLYAKPEVKAALAAMTTGKCAYCESYYDATQPQDTEHYRPKGRIDTPGGKRQPGYWWLASTWENLLPSCIRCNREEEHELYDGSRLKTGKGDRFPLEQEGHRATARDAEGQEVPLLLDPSIDDPVQFLVFVEEEERSIVKPRSPDPASLAYKRARESIDVYGLNRVGLVRLRSRGLKRIKQSLALVEWLARMIESAPPLERDSAERLFLDEVEMIRAHVSGADGFAAVAQPLAEREFARLGLQL